MRRLLNLRSRSRIARTGTGPLAWALFCAGMALLAPAHEPAAQEIQRIAAIVNDEVISAHDLDRRIALVISSAALRDTPETRRRLRDQVLRGLIDERVQLQEAGRLNITVSDEDMDRAITLLERQNNVPAGRFEEFLQRQGVDKNALVQQLRAELAWSKVVRRKLLPTIDISDEEVQSTLQRLQASRGVTESLVSEVFLGVDSPDIDEEVRRSAERLVEQLRRGAQFGAVARQFSQGTTAASGGDVGWVQPGTLPEEIDMALDGLEKGQISDPVRTVGGYYILQLRDRRQIMGGNPDDATVELKQILLPLGNGPAAPVVEEAMQKARSIGDRVEGCESFDGLLEKAGSPGSGDLGKLKIRDLPAPFRPVVATLPIGKLSEPLRSDNGVHLLMVCDRTEVAVNLPSQDEVRAGLVNRRAALLARRYMRDLRRDAVVEFR